MSHPMTRTRPAEEATRRSGRLSPSWNNGLAVLQRREVERGAEALHSPGAPALRPCCVLVAHDGPLREPICRMLEQWGGARVPVCTRHSVGFASPHARDAAMDAVRSVFGWTSVEPDWPPPPQGAAGDSGGTGLPLFRAGTLR